METRDCRRRRRRVGLGFLGCGGDRDSDGDDGRGADGGTSHPRRVGLDIAVARGQYGADGFVASAAGADGVGVGGAGGVVARGYAASTAATLGIALRMPQRTAIAVTVIQVVGAFGAGGSGGRLRVAVLLVRGTGCRGACGLAGLGIADAGSGAVVGLAAGSGRRAEAEQGRRVAEARTLERTKMAREMHDVLAHRLSLLATYAGALEYRPDSSPEKLAQAAGVIRTGVHQALDELREVISVLRDTEIEEGPGGRPQPTFADIEGLVAESRAAGRESRTTIRWPTRRRCLRQPGGRRTGLCRRG